MRETWYVLEDDSVVHPSEVDHSNMTHKNGKVAMRGDVPSTRGVEVDDKGKRTYSGPHDHLHKDWKGADDEATKEATPATGKATYKTRESKAK